MSKTVAKPAISATRITECAVRATEHYARRNDVPVAPRSAVVGSLTRGTRSLEEANRAITVARRRGDLVQVRVGAGRYLAVCEPGAAETLLDSLEEYLEASDEPDSTLVGAVNGARQELRDGGDS